MVRLYIELDNVRDKELLETAARPPKADRGRQPDPAPVHVEAKRSGGGRSTRSASDCATSSTTCPGRVATRLPRVFIAGDACHTHSAKAGQGMNVSMADTWNLGWKLAAVLRGTAGRSSCTPIRGTAEVAEQLIDFDREFSAMFSAHPRPGTTTARAWTRRVPVVLREQGRFTAGVATQYDPSMLTAAPTYQHLAAGFPVGMRFHSAPVVRRRMPSRCIWDTRPGRRRLAYLHLRRPDDPASGPLPWALLSSCQSDVSPAHPIHPGRLRPRRHHRRPGCLPAVTPRSVPREMPAVLRPRKGQFGLIDYEDVLPRPQHRRLFDLRRINRDTGCLVLVRPDQYVAHVLPLHGYDALNNFFAGILNDAQ